MTYVAPETEQMDVKVESGFLTDSQHSVSAESFSTYNDDQDW